MGKQNELNNSNKNNKENESISEKDATTDFIKRNIELAKDAGSMVQMTKEEKERLTVLLQDIEEKDGQNCVQISTTTTENSGYQPEVEDRARLEEINKMLMITGEDLLFADEDSSVISSVPPTVRFFAERQRS